MMHRKGKHSVVTPLSGNEALVIDPSALSSGGPNRTHTQYPYVTGTSVLGVTYKDGVMLACDTLGAYGSTKRYKSFERLNKVNDSCVIAAGGELSDFQHIVKMLGELADEDFCLDDGHQLKPGEVFAYLTRVMYDRRNKFDPLWNSVVVAGYHGGTPFLGTVGMIGTNYKDETIATGFGNHLARPLMRERHRPDMDESEALQLLHDCLRVCYYRDKVSINKFQVSKVTKDGVEISEPFSLETKWDYKLFVNPTANAVGAW
jgi:20S proteasome subunit beta 7